LVFLLITRLYLNLYHKTRNRKLLIYMKTNDTQNTNKLNLNRVKRYTQSDVPHSDLLPRHQYIRLAPAIAYKHTTHNYSQTHHAQLFTNTPCTVTFRNPSNIPCPLNNPRITSTSFNKNFKDSLVRNSTLFQKSCQP
jgi:hypothetical protein